MSEQTKVRVRMYRQGLGDCFLLRFTPPSGAAFSMVIDCGVFTGSDGQTERMREIAQDISVETTGAGEAGRVDVLVATHQHGDHLSGFNQARAEWDSIAVDELWLAWTEQPDDPLGAALRTHRLTTRGKIAQYLKSNRDTLTDAQRAQLEGLLGCADLAADEDQLSGPERALEYLREKAQRPRYFRPGEVITLAALPGVRFYVLGPPTTDLLFKNDPSLSLGGDPMPELVQRQELIDGFFSAVPHQEDQALDEQLFPFDAPYRLSPRRAREMSFFHKHYFSPTDEDGRPQAKRAIDQLPGVMASLFALDLDHSTNNTSLALAIELTESGRVLLFPGDAQVGSWRSWEDLAWDLPDAADGTRRVTGRDLLARTVLYKVSHHGSHNATHLTHGINHMTSPELVALVPLDMDKAESVWSKRAWPDPDVLRELLARTQGRLVISDRTQTLPPSKDLPAGWRVRHEELLELQRATFDIREAFIDYHIAG
ncbi:MAG: hypothetical protein RLZZ387_166 [Chloroflexota bacterium]|jgi:glyoxylase-like metal-dependent hydrolase (beta-lactamase superfamily II)